MNMKIQMIQAREIAGHSRAEAAVLCRCGLSTVYALEHDGKEPQQKAIRQSIQRYIRKWIKQGTPET